jgi:hypothetical protein
VTVAADPFDVKTLRIDPTGPAFARSAAAPRKKWKRQFIIFSWAWLARLKTTKSGAACRLALFLTYEHWRTGGRTIRLTNAALVEVGVSRRTKGPALAELERIGLIKVERRPRKSPLVTILIDPRAGS